MARMTSRIQILCICHCRVSSSDTKAGAYLRSPSPALLGALVATARERVCCGSRILVAYAGFRRGQQLANRRALTSAQVQPGEVGAPAKDAALHDGALAPFDPSRSARFLRLP
jgi:hypothetical protein